MEKILTIVIPTYNMEKYLSKCLDSIILPKEKMRLLEVLVINDGSTDSSSEIGHKYESQFPETIRVVDKKNGNYGSCVNSGLQEASGKYIKVLDADDSFDNINFGAYLSFLSGVDSDLVLSDYNIIDEKGHVVKSISFSLSPYTTTSLNDVLDNENVWIWHQSVAYKTENLKRIGYSQTEGISYTDEEWVFKPMIAVNSITYFPKPLYLYLRGREGQTYDPAILNKSFGQLLKVTESLAKFYSKEISEKDENAQKKWLKKRMLIKLIIIYRFYLIKHCTKEGNHLLAQFDKNVIRKCLELSKMTDEMAFELGFHYIRKWRKTEYNRNSSVLFLFRILYKVAIKGKNALQLLHILQKPQSI